MPTDPLVAVMATYEERHVEMDDGAVLRVMCWQPHRAERDWPVVFVAGWISLVSGWAHLLHALVVRQPVYYVETRDKSSARLPAGCAPAQLTIGRNARDLGAVLDAIGVPEHRRVIVASSLGATVLLEALKLGLKAHRIFLIGPSTEFPNPWWLLPLTYLPSWLYPPVRDALLWYLRTFRVDAEAEPEQMARYERTMGAAEPTRLKLSARVFRGFTVWDGLDRIEVPVAVAWAETDKLHGAEQVRRLVEALPRAVAVPCPSNLYMHRAEVVADIDAFVDAGP